MIAYISANHDTSTNILCIVSQITVSDYFEPLYLKQEHSFPDFSQFPRLIPDHFQIPGLYEVLHVGDHPVHTAIIWWPSCWTTHEWHSTRQW